MRHTICAALVAGALSVLAHAALADGSPESAVGDDPNFKAGKSALDAKNWKAAIDAFSRASAKHKDEPDIYNYLGYAYRKSGDLDNAFKYYTWALRIEPAHRGAHEYMGEAYLMKNDLASAEKQLGDLERLCQKSCVEYKDLAEAISDFKAKKPVASR